MQNQSITQYYTDYSHTGHKIYDYDYDYDYEIDLFGHIIKKTQ